MAHPDDQGGGTFSPALPFSISCLSTATDKRYMLYDIDLITWLRREHHILGVLVGTLPQAPSQNVFLGLPLTLMPEEAKLLVEKGLARIVDDRAWFLKVSRDGLVESKVTSYRTEIIRQGTEAAEAAKKVKDIKMANAIQKMSQNQQTGKKKKSSYHPVTNDILFGEQEDVVTDGESELKVKEPASQTILNPYAITPTLATALRSQDQSPEIPQVGEPSYSVFKLLHDKGYFMSPGLRFGCQYMAYPGDPLRYHSHFLTIAVDWNEDIDLIEIIGGGRLATGVKKSFLLGSVQPANSADDAPKTRAFSLEWAGM